MTGACSTLSDWSMMFRSTAMAISAVYAPVQAEVILTVRRWARNEAWKFWAPVEPMHGLKLSCLILFDHDHTKMIKKMCIEHRVPLNWALLSLTDGVQVFVGISGYDQPWPSKSTVAKSGHAVLPMPLKELWMQWRVFPHLGPPVGGCTCQRRMWNKWV